jgi:hypothetical protein
MGFGSTRALLGAFLIGIAATPALAQGTPSRMIGSLSVRELCSAVATPSVELEPVHELAHYRYQNMLFRAAGVDPTDVKEVVNQKLRSFMNSHLPEMQCDLFNFNPRNGNILKLAAASLESPFIFDALNRWKIDLNQVDPVDGFTVLDAIEQRDDAYKPGRTRVLKNLYRRFRNAGARHRFEIEATGKALPPVESTAQVMAKLESQVQAGEFFSAMRLADIYADGRILNGPIAPDLDKARLWLERAGALAVSADNDGKTSDAHWVGMAYGALKDRAAELRWYAKAVELAGTPSKERPPIGWYEANFELGKAYALGTGVPRNLDVALVHMTRANEGAWAPGGEAIATSQRWMGYVAELRGDREKAARWYRTARSALGSDGVPPGSGQSFEAWLATNGLPECGPDIYGNKDC